MARPACAPYLTPDLSRFVAVLPPAPHKLASRELLYAAVTRARDRALLVGDQVLLAAALARRKQRLTSLGSRLAGL